MADDEITVIEVSEGMLDGTTTMVLAGGYTLAHPDYPDTKVFFPTGSRKIQIWVGGEMVNEWSA